MSRRFLDSLVEIRPRRVVLISYLEIAIEAAGDLRLGLQERPEDVCATPVT